MNATVQNTAVYAGKVLSAILLSWLFSLYSHVFDLTWILISAFLVLSPEGEDAMELAVTRIKANFIGAGTALVLVFTRLPDFPAICIGAVVALVICSFFNLNAGARSTLAAVVIILMEKEAPTIWEPSLDRLSSVILGCLLSLGITWLFHSLFKFRFYVQDEVHEKPRKPEREI